MASYDANRTSDAYSYVEQPPTYDKTQRWWFRYTASDFNDTFVGCRLPPELANALPTRRVVLDSVRIGVLSAAVGVTLSVETNWPFGFIGAYTTVRVRDVAAFNDTNQMLNPSAVADGTAWIQIHTGNYGANDDLYVEVLGHNELYDLVGVVAQPVSLEGYKWPLVRR